MKNLIIRKKLFFTGAVLGALAGFLYWYYIGCSSGSCAITSNPFNSTIYGALMGGLFLSLFQKEKQTEI